MKIEVKYQSNTFVAVWRRAISSEKSTVVKLTPYTFIRQWVKPKIVMPNKAWLDRQTLHYEEPYND